MIHRAFVVAALVTGWALAFSEPAAADQSYAAENARDSAERGATADGTHLDSAGCPSGCCCCYCQPMRQPWFGGGEYRQLRTHFSEAVGFATLTASIGPGGPDLRVSATELDFGYDDSFAVHMGCHLNQCSDIRLSYAHLDTDVQITGVAALGQVIVDPFGNLAPPGTTIDARASVKLHVFDLEYLRHVGDPCCIGCFTYSAGLRYAEVEQFYESTISAGGAPLSIGRFNVDWSGVGPYASLTGRVWAAQRLSLFAKAGTALLIGSNDITTDMTVTAAGAPLTVGNFAFTGGQSAGRILVVPVLESEVGVSWQPSDRLRLSGGWLVQAWFDLGVSGGTFSGQNLPALGLPAIQNVFGGADDANIMAFEGWFARAEWNY